MRIVRLSKVNEFLNEKKAIYSDFRCVITKHEDGIICVFKEPFGIPSKRQRVWLKYMLNKVAINELGKGFKIVEESEKPYYLMAYEKNSNKEDRKDRKKKPASKRNTKGTVSRKRD